MSELATALERFAGQFNERKDSYAFCGAHRQRAMNHLAAAGFPGRKNESWKYTPVRRIVDRPYSFVDPAPIGVHGLQSVDAHRVVFVNGHFDAAQSRLDGLPEGVTVTNLSSGPTGAGHLTEYASLREPFTALNTAFMQDGACIQVAGGVRLDRPIHVVHALAAEESAQMHPRTLIVAEPGAVAQIIQSTEIHSTVPVLVNGVTEIRVASDASVDHMDLLVGTDRTCRVSNVSVYQEASSRFYNGSFTFGGALVRNNVSILPDAEACETIMHGLFVARGRSHIDNNTLVDHAKPNCFSSEYYKGILDDHAVGVFNGKVLVRQDAQLTNAYQTNRSIVLSDTARMFSKPALEIYADDVKCSHGATTGRLDEDALFYLRSRGINLEGARRLMLMSFTGEIIEQVPSVSLRDVLFGEVASFLR